MNFNSELLEFFTDKDEILDMPLSISRLQSEDSLSQRRFYPNLSNCRYRKSSDARSRADSLSSNEESLYCQKNRDFYFGTQDEYPLPQFLSRLSSQNSDFCVKNLDFYFKCESIPAAMELDRDHLEEAQDFAKDLGGECLSSACADSNIPLTYRCKLGHIWESCEVLLFGKWCSPCSSVLAAAQKHAASRGGSCLNSVCELYIEYQCKEAHH